MVICTVPVCCLFSGAKVCLFAPGITLLNAIYDALTQNQEMASVAHPGSGEGEVSKKSWNLFWRW